MPVTGWWNLRFVLTLREGTGCKMLLHGLIQPMTTPFRLFVLSERAPEMPFWIYNRSENVMQQVKYKLKMIPRRLRVPLLIQQLCPWDWVPWPAVYEIFHAPPMPYTTEKKLHGMDRLTKKNVLSSEWLFQNLTIQFLQSKKGIRNQRPNIAHRVYCPSEVTTMMHQWIAGMPDTR